MPEFRFRGRLVLSGVTFYLSAPSLEAAKKQAAEGHYDDYEADNAEAVDCKISPETAEENT